MKNILLSFIKKHSKFTLIEDEEILKFMNPPLMRFDSLAYENYINNKNKIEMKKEDLIIGKEYCYSIFGNFVGTYKGFLSPDYIFHDKQRGLFMVNAKDIDKKVCEVDVPQKPFNFTTPIAMKFNEEQLNVIKDIVFEMGYKEVSMSRWNVDSYLVNNVGNTIGYLSNLSSSSDIGNGRMIFQSFNPDLFLALAAMTDKEDGIKGEWWKAKAGVGFHVQQGGEVCGLTRAFFRKATAQEIIEHFEKKEFVLPKFWHVVVTEENVDVLSKWRFGEEYPKYKLNIGYIVGFSSWQNSKQHNPSDSRGSFGFEITSDQFKKYVLKETEQPCQIIPIPPTKQATLFDDRVEITDWKPKEGDWIYSVVILYGKPTYRKCKFAPNRQDTLMRGKIFKTESEAKQLVEKLKQAML